MSSSSKTSIYAAGLAVSILIAGGIYYYVNKQNEESTEPKTPDVVEPGNFVDPTFDKNIFLTKVAANTRS